jgi:tagatose-6-phosphate ketose/aldose isomerase
MLGITKEYYEKQNSIHTVREILQQPVTWKKTYQIIQNLKDELTAFMKQFDQDTMIYLSGAGTSEFVGNTIQDYINHLGKYTTKSVSTTDMVLNPGTYFRKYKKTLLISFGRSGSSPESVATVDLANQLCDDIYHLIITCNKAGNLAQSSKGKANYFLLTLPEETHDQSFAMTSSYTNMMLATILALDLEKFVHYEQMITTIAQLGEQVINQSYKIVNQLIDNFDFDRIIYLGSGEHKGMAQEAALKVLELTAGHVATMHNTALGFRHGPKSIIQPGALTVFYISDDHYMRQYELDLLNEMLSEKDGNAFLVITNQPLGAAFNGLKYKIELNYQKSLNNMTLVFPYILIAQILALKKSNQLGISSDNPCPSGAVNRVVKGVKIYQY